MPLTLTPVASAAIPRRMTAMEREYAEVVAAFLASGEEAAEVGTNGSKPGRVLSGLNKAISGSNLETVEALNRNGTVYLRRK